MTEQDKREAARRFNAYRGFRGAFTGYLTGVDSFEKCAVAALEYALEDIDELEANGAAMGG